VAWWEIIYLLLCGVAVVCIITLNVTTYMELVF
jgi:hypothetical protein